MLFVLIDIAKIRQLSEQNKFFADFRQDYMRHGSQFVTKPPQAPISCRVEPAGFGSGGNNFFIVVMLYVVPDILPEACRSGP